jgi:hypothetical protein
MMPHFSHFTGQYRRRYGELPSATLRATRENSLPLLSHAICNPILSAVAWPAAAYSQTGAATMGTAVKAAAIHPNRAAFGPQFAGDGSLVITVGTPPGNPNYASGSLSILAAGALMVFRAAELALLEKAEDGDFLVLPGTNWTILPFAEATLEKQLRRLDDVISET